MSRRRDLVVEFVGLPASGKTTLAEAVEERLEGDVGGAFESNESAVTTSSGLRATGGTATAAARATAELLRAPRRTARYLRGVRASGQPTARHAATYVGYQLYLWAELRRATDGAGIHLSDQGFLQHLWRIHLTAGADDAAYLRRLAAIHYPAFPTDVVVFVDVDHRTRMNRGVERGTDVDEELFDPDHPEIRKDIDTYRDVKALVDELESAHVTDVRTMTVENEDGTLDANADAIRDRILEAYRDRS